MSDYDEIANRPNLIEAKIGMNGQPEVAIAAFQLEEAYHFGRFLADVARHGALAYASTWELDDSVALEDICRGLSDQLREQLGDVTMLEEGSTTPSKKRPQ